MPALLLQRIIERIQQQGAIPFADYMRIALYEPDHGYYVSGRVKIGWEGDYYTSTDVADFFAHCMGRQLQRMWAELGRPTLFTVLEQGAGRGDLARAVRRWATLEAPDFNIALDYQTEDINAGQNALTTLISAPHKQSADLQSNNGRKQQNGDVQAPTVILSNELVDAFPVHIVQKQGEKLYEVYVDIQNGQLIETLGEPSNPEVEGYLDANKIPWHVYDDGWRAEINLDALHWMKHTAQRLLLQYPETDRRKREIPVQPSTPLNRSYSTSNIPKRSSGNALGPDPRRKRHGFILAIDYGDTARKLYTRERHFGTLTCYYQHQLTDRPLIRPGEQDITAHVNFTALIREGRKHGLHLQTLTTQREWLSEMGIYEELEHIHQHDFAIIDNARASDKGQAALLQWYNLRQRVSLLTEPTGMGNFKVLILKR